MRFTKPAWVMHKDGSMKAEGAAAKRVSIFSVHVHPDGSRIATGGIDAKIRIWSTKPILNPAAEAANRPPKSLCTLTMHTGPVLTVRWAHSGRWLASGSDDAIVMVWDLDPNARGRVWGSDEVNVEGWKALKRLPGHESDVTDVAWAPEDRYLASVALDSKVIVWCGFTLERLRKLDLHQGFVKGVCWDPVGEFFATQSDDRTVKIWRTKDWSLEAEVTKPFEDSPGSTFFRRLSWSPDGAHITASNATNNKGMVFIAAVITRNTWNSEISLVGHENTVEVAAYNPHIFLRDPSSTGAVQTANICSVVALGADDRSVSIWQTKSARPLIVAREVFERQIMDLSWSWDGLTLYAASSDGTIAVFDFDADELEGIAPHSVQEQYLAKFDFVPPPIPAGYSHRRASEANTVNANAMNMTPPPSPRGNTAETNGFEAQGAVPGEEKINVLVAKRKRKHESRGGGTGGFVPNAANNSNNTNDAARMNVNLSSANHMTAPSPRASSFLSPFGSSPSTSTNNGNNNNMNAMTMPTTHAPSHLKWSHSNTHPRSHSNSASPAPQYSSSFGGYDPDPNPNMMDTTPIDSRSHSLQRPADPGKSRTLGGDRTQTAWDGGSREIVYAASQGSNVVVGSQDGGGVGARSMGIGKRPLMTYISGGVGGAFAEGLLEGRNSEDVNAGPHEITFSRGCKTLWLDYLPSPALAVQATTRFCAVAMLDGAVNVYSHNGRRLMPTLSLGSPAFVMEGEGHALLIITSAGQMFCWNTQTSTAFFPPTSVHPILSSSPSTSSSLPFTLTTANVLPNGTPILTCSNGVVYSYDASLISWVKLSERWWAGGSDVWPGRRAGNAPPITSRGVLGTIEGSLATTHNSMEPPEKDRPKWWGAALTLGHLETKMHACKLLDSPVEYKQALIAYVMRIADEGFKDKAEEIVKDLFGPVYWRPGRNEGAWCPTVVGLSKRELLKDVLPFFVRSKTLAKMGMDWQDTLKRATAGE